MTATAEVPTSSVATVGSGRTTFDRHVVGVLRSPLSTPLASATVLLLSLAAIVLRSHPADTDGVVAWTSTNINNLDHHPIPSMIVSAFVVPGGLVPELIVVAITFAFLERGIGPWRTAVVAVSGHVLATLITEYGLDLGVRAHLFPLSSTDRSDVGVSYAMYAVLAASTLLLTGRRRGVAVAAVIGATLIPLLIAPGMTTAGHALSVAIGFAVITLVQPRTSTSDCPRSTPAAPPDPRFRFASAARADALRQRR